MKDKKIVKVIKRRHYESMRSMALKLVRKNYSELSKSAPEEIYNNIDLVHSREILLWRELEPAFIAFPLKGDTRFTVYVGAVYEMADEETKQCILAHEVGHAILHKDVKNRGRRLEKEIGADLFAVRALGFNTVIACMKKINRLLREYYIDDHGWDRTTSDLEMNIRIDMLEYCKKEGYMKVEDFLI